MHGYFLWVRFFPLALLLLLFFCFFLKILPLAACFCSFLLLAAASSGFYKKEKKNSGICCMLPFKCRKANLGSLPLPRISPLSGVCRFLFVRRFLEKNWIQKSCFSFLLLQTTDRRFWMHQPFVSATCAKNENKKRDKPRWGGYMSKHICTEFWKASFRRQLWKLWWFYSEILSDSKQGQLSPWFHPKSQAQK